MSETDQAVHDETTEQTDAPESPDTAETPEAVAESKAAPDKPAPVELTPKQLQELELKVEAALLTTDRPMTATKLGDLLGNVGAKAIQDAADGLNKLYEKTGRSFRIEKVAGGLQVLTLPKYADVLCELHKTRAQMKLSPAAMETLAIIAYQQPIMRAQIENIRGVACGEVLRSLMERHLVKIVGRAEEIGRPMLYGTTKGFLEVFGLSGLKDLPKVEKSKVPQL
jgi:segregation and condensation protein B